MGLTRSRDLTPSFPQLRDANHQSSLTRHRLPPSLSPSPPPPPPPPLLSGLPFHVALFVPFVSPDAAGRAVLSAFGSIHLRVYLESPSVIGRTNHNFKKIKDPFQQQVSLPSVRFLHLLHVKEQKKKRDSDDICKQQRLLKIE
ncbi:hypothetical protein CKAN_02590200 [Cinnamomum micranthum f. kanehirae]|uniref:Uncharacterized protein n=1 Tax=Cinnamomum micranthum f. kanehirae TaxID=337451 RepID=A0A3S4PYN5_9MAGN|nr:hypothetical protein CKAN_02590200 [Cinnamomum micranthum f. kanehirae]